MISEPPSEGATQFIITLLPEIEVVGADGIAGTVTGNIAPFPSLDIFDYPKTFMAKIIA